MSNLFVIDDDTTELELLAPPGSMKGLILPPNHKHELDRILAPPSEIDVVPESELIERVTRKNREKSFPYHIWLRADHGELPANLFQNGSPLCWWHSTTNGVMVVRATMNAPYDPLSAYGGAYKTLGGGRMEGGWCGLSCKVAKEWGIPDQQTWPQGKWDGRITPEVSENASLHRITEQWYNLTRPVYGQEMTWAQVVTCLLRNQPVVVDFGWWRHSVLAVGLEIIDGEICLLILNSWGREWGDRGFGILKGRRKIPDGAVSIRAVVPSAAASEPHTLVAP